MSENKETIPAEVATARLLKEIKDLLIPVSNLAKYHIQQVNETLLKNELLDGHNKQLAEAQKEIEAENAEG